MNVKDSRAEVVDAIIENAENYPWKVANAIHGKLPVVYMRVKKVSHTEAIELTNAIVNNLGTLQDDDDMKQVRNKLLMLLSDLPE